jgi:hypothetical protein
MHALPALAFAGLASSAVLLLSGEAPAGPPAAFETDGVRGAVVDRGERVERAALRTVNIEAFGDPRAIGVAERATVRWTALDMEAISLEDAMDGADAGRAHRVGVGRAMPGAVMTPWRGGEWLRAGEENIWRIALHSPDAQGMRIHFSAFDLPAGARVVVQGDGDARAAVYEGRGPLGDGFFWSPAALGETVVVEYQAPADAPMPTLEIEAISHLYRGFEATAEERGGNPCGLIDVNCRTVDPIARDSVARYTFISGSSTFLCSGCLLNDSDPNTQAGWFLTAEHCIGTQAEASSITAYWFYQSNACNGSVPSLSSLPRSFGAVLLEADQPSDFALLRLNDDPADGQGFAGFTTLDPSVGATVHMIHHPGGSFKRYTEGLIVGTGPQCGGGVVTLNWDEVDGETQGGSSGSPLFNNQWRVVSSLFGICFFGQNPNCLTDTALWNTWGPRLSMKSSEILSYLSNPIPDDGFEDNDDLASAQPIPLGENALRLVDFDDYFVIETCETTDILVTIEFDTADMDADIRLLNENGNTISSNGLVSGSGVVARSDAAPGTYYVRVIKAGGWGGDYTLNVMAGSGEDSDGDGIPDECTGQLACPWDLTGDDVVDNTDLAVLLGAWADPYRGSDLAGMLGAWGPCP